MLDFFKRKYWYSFYLPIELQQKISAIDNKGVRLFLESIKIRFQKLKIKKISENLYYISICFYSENEIDQLKKELSSYREMMPPWVAFPELFHGSPRWNQGFEEDYCIRHWLTYWGNLDFSHKQEYLLKYDCPKEWVEWLENYQ